VVALELASALVLEPPSPPMHTLAIRPDSVFRGQLQVVTPLVEAQLRHLLPMVVRALPLALDLG